MEDIPYLKNASALIVKKIRKRTGLTQSGFADFCRLSRTHISNLEIGDRCLSISSLYLIAQAAGMEPWEVLKMMEEERRSVALRDGAPNEARKR